MRPIIRWNLWDRRWSALGWMLGINAFIALNVLVYSSISGQAQALNQALANLPAGARALFGGNSDFLSPIGYLNSKLYYLFLPLMFTMLAIALSRQLMSRDEDSGTLELLLARPISRAKLLLAKLLTALLIMFGVGASALLVTLLCAWAIDYDVATIRIVQATTMSLLLSLLFASVAWALIGLGRVGRLASAAAGALALGDYLVSSLSGFASWLEFPAKLLPYHYYESTAILEGSYNWWNAVGMIVALLAILSLAFIGFRRRDLN